MNKPYQKLAVIYDEVMRHVNYHDWEDYLTRIFKSKAVSTEVILEHACGTGSLTVLLAEKGYQIVACDRSKKMIYFAQKKLPTLLKQHVKFKICSMEEFQAKKRYPVILCLYDSINYCQSQEELIRAFQAVQKQLTPQGLFIFDVTTEVNSLRYFQNVYQVGEKPDFYYVRFSQYQSDTHLQQNHFTIFLRDKEYGYRKYQEKHVQRIYSPEEIDKCLLESRLMIMESFDDFSFNPSHRDSERIHYLVTHHHD